MQTKHRFFPDQQTQSAQSPRPPGHSTLAHGLRQGLSITFIALAVSLFAGCALKTPPPMSAPSPAASVVKGAGPSSVAVKVSRRSSSGVESASKDVRFIANWVRHSGDNGKLSFVIIDKKNARAFVFDPAGKLLGDAPVLLGAARGDHSVPGIGERPLAQVRPEERTTPAGRFIGEMGRNLSGEDIVWVDYDAAVSMHRVRATNPQERRLQRLASPTTADNRISFGCINMPAAFYEKVLSPQFKGRHGVVYVLPEVKPVREVFAKAYDPSARQRAAIAPGRQAAATADAAPARL